MPEQEDRKYDEQDTPNLIGRGGIAAFWISWYEGVLTVGYGHGKDAGATLLKLPHAMTEQINGLSFASPKSNAYWHVPQTDGAYTCAGSKVVL